MLGLCSDCPRTVLGLLGLRSDYVGECKVLTASRNASKISRGYDFEKTRATIRNKFSESFNGKEPYTWQVDVCEAILLELDCRYC